MQTISTLQTLFLKTMAEHLEFFSILHAFFVELKSEEYYFACYIYTIVNLKLYSDYVLSYDL